MDRGRSGEYKGGDIYDGRWVDDVEVEKEELGGTGHSERHHGQQKGEAGRN